MQEIMIEILNQFGYIGVAALIAVENLFPPIPSEVILTFSGFMTTYTTMHVGGVVLASTLGSVIGAIILYSVGKLVSPERMKKFLAGKAGKMLHLYPEDVEKAQEWFNSKGNLTVFFCRFIPIIRSLISIPAGMAQMPMGIFLVLTTAGSFLWNLVLVWLGAFAGASWERVVAYMGTYSHVGKYMLFAGAFIAVAALYIKRKHNKK